MSVADAPLPSPATAPVAAAPAPAPVPSAPQRPIGARPPAPPLREGLLARTRPPAPRPDGLSRKAGRRAAVAFAVAWILCPAVEPMPTHDMPYPLWQLPVDLATVASIVAAVVVLWRGGRNGPRLAAFAGIMMSVETAMCPFAGHTPVGWWTWVQTGLSLFVLGTGALLMKVSARQTA